MKARFHPAAEQELAAAVALGEARGSGLGLEFLAEEKSVADGRDEYEVQQEWIT